MNQKGNTVLILIIIATVVILGGGTWFYLSQKTATQTTTPQLSTQPVSTPALTPTPTPIQSSANSANLGCPELKASVQQPKSGVPFTIQNTDSKPHTLHISTTSYQFAAGQTLTITINGTGNYQPACDVEKGAIGTKIGSLTIIQ